MYLFLWKDGTVEQFHKVPDDADLVLMKDGSLRVLRFSENVFRFQELVLDVDGPNTFAWQEVINGAKP